MQNLLLAVSLLYFTSCEAGRCKEWFERNPERCNNAAFRRWCPQASAAFCGDDGPQNDQHHPDDHDHKDGVPHDHDHAESEPNNNQKMARRDGGKEDCSSWFADKPGRCNSKMYVSWCPGGAKKMCSQDQLDKAKKNEGKGKNKSGEKNGKGKSKANADKGREKDQKKDKGQTKKDKSKEKKSKEKKEKSKEKDNKSKEKSKEKKEKSKEKKEEKKSKDEIFRECAKDHDLPEKCLKFATYKRFDVKKMSCEEPDCVDHTGPLVYCMTNGQDHSGCCADAGVDNICEPFCNGKKKVRINVMFGSIGTAVKYLPCVQKAKEIGQCSDQGHSGKREAKTKYFKSEKLNPQMRALMKNQC